jgi:hypothetical protein
MGNYVEIKTSVTDILNIANELQGKGRDLKTAMATATENVTTLENHAETLPPDKFTTPFLEKYHEPVDTGDGQTAPANEAMKQSAIGLGAALSDLAGKVSTAMVTYAGTDAENAADIEKTPRV